MNQGHATGLSSRDRDLLNRIEELRARLLDDQGIREQISRRAYELYEQRGGEPGRDVEDWIRAENEILSPLIEGQIHRAAKAAKTQTTESSGINIRNAIAKNLKPPRTYKSGVANKRSAKSRDSDPRVSKRVTKKKAVGKGKRRKSKMQEADRSARTNESNDK